eukprot:CAMPEP_0196995490 /NCGR_PEP_ID=MMETSP1380-20130617/1582_1 /TAXON_ID=5936 /ORGANISM="Euplotes crassus, Strain CT5" /LENGTH=133 /DNA_ID=CAMNT_0042411161 /DNA_START=335 /DNA_END=736 /DNA_ORIENTATION=+
MTAGLVMVMILMGLFFFHIGVFFWFLFRVIVYLGYFYDSDKFLLILWWLAVAVQTFPLIIIFVIFFMRRKLQQSSQMNQGVFAPLNQNPQAYAQNPYGQAPAPGYQQVPSSAMPTGAPYGSNSNIPAASNPSP